MRSTTWTASSSSTGRARRTAGPRCAICACVREARRLLRYVGVRGRRPARARRRGGDRARSRCHPARPAVRPGAPDPAPACGRRGPRARAAARPDRRCLGGAAARGRRRRRGLRPARPATVARGVSPLQPASLAPRALERGAPLLAEALRGRTRGVPQPADGVTYAAKIGPADRRIDWTRPASEVANRVRALSPHIGARAELDGVPVIVWRARPLPGDGEPGAVTPPLVVACGEGAVEVLDLQPGGRRRMSAAEYLRGLRHPPERAARARGRSPPRSSAGRSRRARTPT